jgi:Predicted periplasmic lipoprotein (DUF2279)
VNVRTEDPPGSARRRAAPSIAIAVLFGAATAAVGAEAFAGAGVAEGSGFERSFDLALRQSGTLADGFAGLDRVAPCLEEACVDEVAEDANGPSLSPPLEKKPKKFWITAVSVATIVGSGLNSFTDGPNQRFHFLNEGFFSENTYAGGADKASHFASYYIVAQLLGNVYEGLGMTKDNAQLLSAGVSAFAGLMTEIGDGRGHYGFSYEDFVFDVLSAATYLGIHHYGLEDLVGFSFGPIPAQPKPAGCCTVPDVGTGTPRYYDFGQDYSTTISSGNFKIAGLKAHTGFDPGLARFLLVSTTYTSKGYRYYADKDLTQRQIGMFVGVNFVEILKAAGVPNENLWQKALYFLFDVIRIPYTQIGYVYDLNHGRWHGPTIGSYPD